MRQRVLLCKRVCVGQESNRLKTFVVFFFKKRGLQDVKVLRRVGECILYWTVVTASWMDAAT